MSFQEIGYLGIQHALSESCIVWICHRCCRKIKKDCIKMNPLSQPDIQPTAHLTNSILIDDVKWKIR